MVLPKQTIKGQVGVAPSIFLFVCFFLFSNDIFSTSAVNVEFLLPSGSSLQYAPVCKKDDREDFGYTDGGCLRGRQKKKNNWYTTLCALSDWFMFSSRAASSSIVGIFMVEQV